MEASTIVRRIRTVGGLSQADLARLAGVSASTVGRVESGQLDPTWGTLQKLLNGVGMVLSGQTVISAGDVSAVASARAILEGRPEDADPQWLEPWRRVGWLKPPPSPPDVLALAVAAGNATKFVRRASRPNYVKAPAQREWQDLPRLMTAAGIDYAISGLVATRPDRVTSPAAVPIIYVHDPRKMITRLGLTETEPLHGTKLVAPTSNEMSGFEEDGGLRFVTRAQAMLDAFASGGREQDKAEAIARS